MGRSLYAKLAFGIDLGYDEDREFPIPAMLRDGYDPSEDGEGDEDGSGGIDLDAYITRKAGLIEPSGNDYSGPEYKAFWAAQREAVAAFPLVVERQGVGDYCGSFIALRRSVQSSNYTPEAVSTFEIFPEEVAAMKAFFDETGLPWSEPAWCIFALYW
jgi:hypothetical protein